jgi:hypothetical protein
MQKAGKIKRKDPEKVKIKGLKNVYQHRMRNSI